MLNCTVKSRSADGVLKKKSSIWVKKVREGFKGEVRLNQSL